MPRIVKPQCWVTLSLVAAAACAPPVSRGQRALSDKQALLAQELGEMPVPAGACPEHADADVLGNPRAPVQRTALGVAYCILHEGPPGVVPGPNDSVLVHYSGWTLEGRMFDSSVERGQPVEFAVGNVIRGWTEGLQLMTPGDKARLWIPAHMAYGQKKSKDPADTTPLGPLTFDIELVEVRRAPPPQPEPLATEGEPKPRLAPRGVSAAESAPIKKRELDDGHSH